MADQTQTTAWPSELAPYWTSYLQRVNQLTSAPMPVYGGPQVAPWNQNQNTAAAMMNQFATNGSPAGNAANLALIRQANGVANPYEGDNPYLQSMIDSSNADISKAYANGVAAQTDAAAARAGAYGGTGYQSQVGMNQDMLAKNLAANTSNLRYQNYINSGNLFGQDQNRQLQAAALGPQSQAADMSAMQGLFNVGTAQQGTTQADFDAARKYFTQTVQSPFTSLDIFGSAISRAQGNTGTMTTDGPGTSPLAYAGLLPIIYAAMTAGSGS